MAPTSDGKQLFAAVRSEPYSLFNYRIDAKTGALTWTGTSPMPDSMVYISIDRAGKWLLAVSYGGDVLSVQAIGADGRVAGESTQLIPSGGIKPHAILVDKTNKFVYVPHLGTDEIRVCENALKHDPNRKESM
jgi:6-phosphogluconolactonase